MRTRIAITGASGALGQALVPLLADAGYELLLLGREPHRLESLHPAHRSVGYADMASELPGCAALLHLAVMNNDKAESLEAFRAANVSFLVRVAEAARAASVPLFVNVTTWHALEPRGDSYAASKREGEEALEKLTGLNSVNLRLPAVYGERFSGRLRALGHLPRFLRLPALMVAAAFRPVVAADRVAETVVRLIDEGAEGEAAVADPQENNPAYRILKRVLDLAFAAVVVLLFFWLLIAAWLVVRLSTPGPGLFAQPRVGRDEKIFTCYKFRTMELGAPQAGTKDVPAVHITPVGRVLRRTKIDELPQVLNILRGEMSLVGPRPCLPSQTELVAQRRKLGVFRCTPGITGLAQVQGVDMSEPERLARLDARYCAFRTIPMDVKITLLTLVPGMARRRSK